MKVIKCVLNSLFFIFLSPLIVLPGEFQGVTTLSTNISPRGIAIGNVFGNGKESVVVANFGSSTFIGQSTPASLLGAANFNLQIFSPSPEGLQLSGTISTASSPRGLCLFDISTRNRQDIFVTAYDAKLLQIFNWEGSKFTKVDEAPTLNMPVGVATGFTRPSGLPFVAVADYGSNSLSLYSLKGGSLGNRIDIPVDGGPTQLAIGNLNGTGSNQIAVVCLPANKIDILSLDATGSNDDLSSFKIVSSISLPDGSAPSDLRIADLNNDGRQDLVVADFSKSAISLFLQQKDGSLLAQPLLPTSGSHPNGLTVADLNGNGEKEIIVANRDSDSIDIFQPSGSSYQLMQTLKTSEESNGSFGPVEVGVLDTRGIGTKDLVASHMRSNSLKVLTQVLEATPTPTASSIFVEEVRASFSEKTTFCYPNPTHDGNVKFSFELGMPSKVILQVFDVTGEKVWGATLNAGQTQNGINNINWSGTNQMGQNLASGIYVYNVTVGNQTVTKKLAIIR